MWKQNVFCKINTCIYLFFSFIFLLLFPGVGRSGSRLRRSAQTHLHLYYTIIVIIIRERKNTIKYNAYVQTDMVPSDKWSGQPTFNQMTPEGISINVVCQFRKFHPYPKERSCNCLNFKHQTSAKQNHWL